MDRRLWFSTVGAALASTILPGCKGERARPSMSEGTEEGAAGAHRVVSLSPNTTETVFALGAGARLVGRSRYCDFPPEATKLPSVGGYVDASLEAILGLVPDLVVGARGPAGHALVDKLASLGIATFFPPTESMAEIEAMIRGLAERLAVQGRGAELVAAVQNRCAEVRAAVANESRPKVLLVFGLGPIVVAGPDSFANELIGLARAENVIASGGAYPTLSLERVMGLDPDVVVDAAWGESQGGERINTDEAGWRELRAVKVGRVVRITDEALLRPGPRIGDGLAVLAQAVHPGAAISKTVRAPATAGSGAP